MRWIGRGLSYCLEVADGLGGGVALRCRVFAGREAEELFALAVAELAALIAARAFAVGMAIRDIGTSALVERGQFATLVGFDAQTEDALPETLGESLGAAVVFFDLFGAEPAGGGEIVRTLRLRFAEALALPFVEALVVAPDGLEANLIGRPGEAGAKEGAIDGGEDIGNGLLGEGRLVSGLETRGTRQGEGGDLAGVEDFAGAVGVESVGEEALGDLGGDDLDGVEVFEERDGDARAFGTDGEAVFGMRDAEVMTAQGAFAALETADGEGAAAAGSGSGLRVRGTGIRVRDGGWI